MNTTRKVMSAYHSVFYSRLKNLRGITRLTSLLENLFLSIEITRSKKGFNYSYKGLELVCLSRDDFKELILYKDTILGYTMEKDISENSIVVDAGAYPGEFTIYAAKKAKKVLALEPDSDNADKLRKIIELNNIDNVEVIEKGLWSESKTKKFESNGEMRSSVSDSGDAEIQVVTLDDLKEEVPQIDFVKMDIEGAEIEAVKGATEVIKDCKPYFAIASYHQLDDSKTYTEIENLMEKNGYNVKTGYNQHLTTWCWPDME